jgi:hypothetical protein
MFKKAFGPISPSLAGCWMHPDVPITTADVTQQLIRVDWHRYYPRSSDRIHSAKAAVAVYCAAGANQTSRIHSTDIPA